VTRSVVRTALPAILIAALSLTLLVRERRAALRMAKLTDRLAESWPLYVEEQLADGETKRLQAEMDRLDGYFGSETARFSAATHDIAIAYEELVRLETTRRARTSECLSETVAKQLPETARWASPILLDELALGTILLHHVVVAYYCTDSGEATWRGFVRPCDDAASAGSLLKEYLEGQRAAGTPASQFDVEGADEALVVAAAGSVDVVFRKGNTVAGATSASDVRTAEAFARRLTGTLPETMPTRPTVGCRAEVKDMQSSQRRWRIHTAAGGPAEHDVR
jgi:hypothetical protein